MKARKKEKKEKRKKSTKLVDLGQENLLNKICDFQDFGSEIFPCIDYNLSAHSNFFQIFLTPKRFYRNQQSSLKTPRARLGQKIY